MSWATPTGTYASGKKRRAHGHYPPLTTTDAIRKTYSSKMHAAVVHPSNSARRAGVSRVFDDFSSSTPAATASYIECEFSSTCAKTCAPRRGSFALIPRKSALIKFSAGEAVSDDAAGRGRLSLCCLGWGGTQSGTWLGELGRGRRLGRVGGSENRRRRHRRRHHRRGLSERTRWTTVVEAVAHSKVRPPERDLQAADY